MKSQLKITALIFFFSGIISSCNKKLDDAYLNPNSPTKVPPETLLGPIISSMVGNSAGHGAMADARYISLYIQSFASYTVSTAANSTSHYERMGGVTANSDNAGAIWRAHYYDIGQNCMKMIEWAT